MCVTGICWVEARDALSILQCPGQPPTVENHLLQNVSGAKVGKPRSRGREGVDRNRGNSNDQSPEVRAGWQV